MDEIIEYANDIRFPLNREPYLLSRTESHRITIILLYRIHAALSIVDFCGLIIQFPL